MINTMDVSADALLLCLVVLCGDSRQGSYNVFNMHSLWDEKQNCINTYGNMILENNIQFLGTSKSQDSSQLNGAHEILFYDVGIFNGRGRKKFR